MLRPCRSSDGCCVPGPPAGPTGAEWRARMPDLRLGDVLDGSEGRAVQPLRPPPGPRTLRTDRWWALPLVTVVVLLGFVVYGTWVAFQNANYSADHYLSPFYSPCLAQSCIEPPASGTPGRRGSPWSCRTSTGTRSTWRSRSPRSSPTTSAGPSSSPTGSAWD